LIHIRKQNSEGKTWQHNTNVNISLNEYVF